MALFATDRPTRSDVEAWRARDDGSGEDHYELLQGFYFTVYKGGRPDEI